MIEQEYNMNGPQPSRHERRRQQTRSSLIQATLLLVLEKGYDAITVQDITNRADLGYGTFYIHFRDKDDVLWAAIEETIMETVRSAHNQFKQEMPAQIEYYGYLNIFHHANEHQDLYRVVFGRQGSARMTGRVQEFLVKGFLFDIHHSTVPLYTGMNLPEEIIACIITSALTSLVMWWLETPNAYSAEQMAGMLYEALHHRKPPIP